MERLDVGSGSTYSDTELALHMSRYLPIRALCPRSRVLDIACGEGYAAHIMRNHWGAARVFAVDVSQEAIAAAKAQYVTPRLKFIRADAVRYLRNSGARFDLVVSVETIEHVPDPEEFLYGIKRVCAPNASVYVSAPNDVGYYGPGPSLNPHHRHVFSYDEFIALGTKVFGPPSQVMLGTVASGFAAIEVSDRSSSSWSEAIETAALRAHAASVPSTALRPVTPDGALFYAALWGGDASEGRRLSSSVAFFAKERTFRLPPIGLAESSDSFGAQSSVTILISRDHESMSLLRHAKKALAPKVDLRICTFTSHNVGRVLSNLVAEGPDIDLWGEEAVRAYFEHDPIGEQPVMDPEAEGGRRARQPTVSCVLTGQAVDYRAISPLIAFVDDAIFLDGSAATTREERLRFAHTLLLHLDRARGVAGQGVARRRSAFLRARRRVAALERRLAEAQRELERLSASLGGGPV